MPSYIEEQAVQDDALPSVTPSPTVPQNHGRSTNDIAGVSLAATALVLALSLGVLGLWLFRSVRSLDRRVPQLGEQIERLNRRVGGTELRSLSLAQEAERAAASAKAAAQQRDDAQEAEKDSAAQAQSAAQAAAVAQDQAKRAQQKSEDSINQRDQALQQLQGVLGQIAETHRTAVGLAMTLGQKSIHFDSGKSEITAQYRDALNRIAAALKALKQYSIYVYGYTDEVGTPEYNLKLSARRAEAVRTALIQGGINPALITTKGFGKSEPRVKGDSSTARSDNRRVEISIVDSRILTEPIDRK